MIRVRKSKGNGTQEELREYIEEIIKEIAAEKKTTYDVTTNETRINGKLDSIEITIERTHELISY